MSTLLASFVDELDERITLEIEETGYARIKLMIVTPEHGVLKFWIKDDDDCEKIADCLEEHVAHSKMLGSKEVKQCQQIYHTKEHY